MSTERRAFSVAVFARNGGDVLLVRHKRLDLCLGSFDSRLPTRQLAQRR